MKLPVSTCPKHSQASNRAYAPAMLSDAPGNAHTDRQTYKHQLTLSDYPRLENARRGAARISPLRGESATPAALRASLIGVSHA